MSGKFGPERVRPDRREHSGSHASTEPLPVESWALTNPATGERREHKRGGVLVTLAPLHPAIASEYNGPVPDDDRLFLAVSENTDRISGLRLRLEWPDDAGWSVFQGWRRATDVRVVYWQDGARVTLDTPEVDVEAALRVSAPGPDHLVLTCEAHGEGAVTFTYEPPEVPAWAKD